MPSYRTDEYRPSAGNVIHGATSGGVFRVPLLDDDGKLITTSQSSAQSGNILSYRSDSNEQVVDLTDNQARLKYLKAIIDEGATDNTRMFVHAIDAQSAPSDGDSIDPITTLEEKHENGYFTTLKTDPSREFALASNGLTIVLSRSRTTYDASGLQGADVAYFEIDYLE